VFPDLGVVVVAAANIAPAEGVDPTCRKIAEAFAQPLTNGSR